MKARCLLRMCSHQPCSMYSNLRAFVNRISTSLCSRLSSRSSTCALRLCGGLLVHSFHRGLLIDAEGDYARRTHTDLLERSPPTPLSSQQLVAFPRRSKIPLFR